jgi:hypothetical protein
MDFLNELASNIGQTVTVFTTSGGQSGQGFTGVLTMVNNSFIRLVTQIGTAPGCALGNCCDPHDTRNQTGNQLQGQGRPNCGNGPLGSIVDIPVDRIAAFVHNAVGSN